jgi:hypothetical protein
LGALVPILFLGSGREEVRNVSEAIAAGADHFFRKPDGLGELLAKVSTYIGPGDETAVGAAEPPHAPVPDERELLAALGRSDDGTPPPTPQPTSSGFFRAIRDVLAVRGSGGDAPVRGEPPPAPAPTPVARSTPSPESLPPQPTETDWAALDSLLAGEPVASPQPAVPTGDAELMRTAAAVMTGGEGALPLGAALTPAPTASSGDPAPSLDRWTVGRRWTDRIDPGPDPDAAAPLPEPLALPVVGAPERGPAVEVAAAPPPPVPVPVPLVPSEPGPGPAPGPVPDTWPTDMTPSPAVVAVRSTLQPLGLQTLGASPAPRRTLEPAAMPLAAPAPAAAPAAARHTLSPGRQPVVSPEPAPGGGAPRQTAVPGRLPTLGRPPVPAPTWDAPPLDLENPPASTFDSALGFVPAASVTGHAAFAPPRAPAHDPADALAAMLEAGRALELERRGVGEVLAAASEAGLTGRVEVAAGGVLRRVFLEGGAPVYADSSEPSEDLATYLAGEGRFTRAVLAEARERARVIGASTEEVLIEAGYLAPDDVYRALRTHVIERVLALFSLEAGEATVIRGGPRPMDPVDLGLHPGRLVLDGIRRKYGRLRLYRAFGTPATVPRPRMSHRPDMPGLVLRHDETVVLGLVDGRRTALEIARTAQLHEVDTLAVLFAFGVLRLIDAPVGVRPLQGLPALDPDALLRAGAPRTDDQMPGFGELLARKYSEIQAADYHQILGVPRGATGAEIRSAWERLKRQFDPHRVRRDGPHWQQVREVAAVLDDAYTILGNERLRARYEAHLE